MKLPPIPSHYYKMYDEDGYNMMGYDKDNFDRNGYNQHGYNVDGYDRNGYNRYNVYGILYTLYTKRSQTESNRRPYG